MEISGHDGHDHSFIDEELVVNLLRDVNEARPINNLFLIPVVAGGVPRFVLTRVDDDLTVHTLGYVPFDMMLDVGIGFITAVRNAIEVGMTLDTTGEGRGEEEAERPVFKVI